MTDVDIAQFRRAVYAEFGSQLEHATPELMQNFICRSYAELSPPPTHAEPLILPDDRAASYAQLVGQFMGHCLDAPDDRALILLWLFAAEMFYGNLGDQYTQEFSALLARDGTE